MMVFTLKYKIYLPVGDFDKLSINVLSAFYTKIVSSLGKHFGVFISAKIHFPPVIPYALIKSYHCSLMVKMNNK